MPGLNELGLMKMRFQQGNFFISREISNGFWVRPKLKKRSHKV